jgi:hypothetical protein
VWRLPAGLPEDIVFLYHGEYDPQNGFSAVTYENFECSAFRGDDIILVRFSDSEVHGSHKLVFGDMEGETGFFSRATAMAVDAANRVWVAGDVRVRSFDLDALAPDDTLYVPDQEQPIRRSCIAVWGDYIVLGTDASLFGWPRAGRAPANQLRRAAFDEFVKGVLDPTAVDWTRGRLPDPHFVVRPEMRDITAVCAVGDFLAVASATYEVVHIYALASEGESQIVTRLVGHTMGVTALLPYGRSSLFTGSVDMTIRQWNLETGTATFSFDRHGGAVSAIALGLYQGSEFLFTGGQDRIVHAWDVTRRKGLCQIAVGDGVFPASLYFHAEHKQLSIVALPLSRPADMEEREAVRQIGQVQVYTFRQASPS